MFHQGSSPEKRRKLAELEGGSPDDPFSFDEGPHYRSLALDAATNLGDDGALGQLSNLNAEVTRSMGGVSALDAAGVDHAGGFWGDDSASLGMSAFAELQMPTFKQQKQEQTDFDALSGSKATSFDSFASNAALVQGVPVPDCGALERVPVYVEKYTSFYTRTLPDKLLPELCAHMTAAAHVDHEYFPHTFTIKGVDFSRGGRCNFHVHCFEAHDGEYLCEFQRRSGTVTDFVSFYRAMLDKLGDEHVARPYTNVPAAPQPQTARANLMRSENQSEVVLDGDTIKSLCEMALGPSVEMQREACRALASVTSSPENQELLWKFASTNNTHAVPCLLKVLTKVLTSGDDTAVRYGAQLLAHVAGHEKSRHQLLTHDDLPGVVLALLDCPSALANRDTKRQLTSALGTLCHRAEECELLKARQDTNALSVLEKYRNCADAVLQANVTQVLTRLEQTR